MQFSKEIRRDIVFVSVGTVVLCGIMLGVFALSGRFSLAVLWGGLIGGTFAALNFFVLAFSLQKAVDSPSRGKGIAAVSYSFRTLLLMVASVLVIVFLKVNAIALVIPYVFPRLVILFMQVTGLYKKEPIDNLEEGGADGS